MSEKYKTIPSPTMGSLQATHTAHRIASEIHFAATPKLQKIRQRSLARFRQRPIPGECQILPDQRSIKVQPPLNAKEERILLGIAVTGTTLLIAILTFNFLK